MVTFRKCANIFHSTIVLLLCISISYQDNKLSNRSILHFYKKWATNTLIIGSAAGVAFVPFSPSINFNGNLGHADQHIATSSPLGKDPYKGERMLQLVFNIDVADAADESLRLQLQILRQQKLQLQKEETQASEDALMSKEILYPDGKLVARGMIMLTPNEPNADFDRTNFPMGLFKASEVSESLNTDEATLFILAVGREGPPVAATKYKLNALSFPFVFEITTENLIFPYNADAWVRSSNSKDSVAITAILSQDGKLSTPSDSEWVGFAVSNPVQIAGTTGRSSAKVTISNRLAKNLYTPAEIENLSGVDAALDTLYSSSTAKIGSK